MEVVIKRSNRSVTNGKPDPAEVYVTAPDFGGDIYSSTVRADEATRFTEGRAHQLIALGKWHGDNPAVLPADSIEDL